MAHGPLLAPAPAPARVGPGRAVRRAARSPRLAARPDDAPARRRHWPCRRRRPVDLAGRQDRGPARQGRRVRRARGRRCPRGRVRAARRQPGRPGEPAPVPDRRPAREARRRGGRPALRPVGPVPRGRIRHLRDRGEGRAVRQLRSGGQPTGQGGRSAGDDPRRQGQARRRAGTTIRASSSIAASPIASRVRANTPSRSAMPATRGIRTAPGCCAWASSPRRGWPCPPPCVRASGPSCLLPEIGQTIEADIPASARGGVLADDQAARRRGGRRGCPWRRATCPPWPLAQPRSCRRSCAGCWARAAAASRSACCCRRGKPSMPWPTAAGWIRPSTWSLPWPTPRGASWAGPCRARTTRPASTSRPRPLGHTCSRCATPPARAGRPAPSAWRRADERAPPAVVAEIEGLARAARRLAAGAPRRQAERRRRPHLPVARRRAGGRGPVADRDPGKQGRHRLPVGRDRQGGPGPAQPAHLGPDGQGQAVPGPRPAPDRPATAQRRPDPLRPARGPAPGCPRR